MTRCNHLCVVKSTMLLQDLGVMRRREAEREEREEERDKQSNLKTYNEKITDAESCDLRTLQLDFFAALAALAAL